MLEKVLSSFVIFCFIIFFQDSTIDAHLLYDVYITCILLSVGDNNYSLIEQLSFCKGHTFYVQAQTSPVLSTNTD